LGNEAGKVINIGMFAVRTGKKLGKSGCCTAGRGRGYILILKLGRHHSVGGEERRRNLMMCSERRQNEKFQL
jgi:hypothetical protein